MLSATDIIPQGWDHDDDDDHDHHHGSYDIQNDPTHHHNLDHGRVDDQHRHRQDGFQVGTGLDEKAGENSSNEAHILKIIRKKRQVEVGLCGDDRSASKVCSDCSTSKTPLWRSGPAGPKSLCNACGIRYRKKRRSGFDFLGLQKQARVLLKRFAGKEEAEAAVLLMALSCGVSVHS